MNNKKYFGDENISRMDLTKLKTEDLVELVIAKKRKSDFLKAEVDTISAEIQTRANRFQAERHIKFTQWKGNGQGLASITLSQSFEITSYTKLKEFFTKEFLDENIKIKPAEIKYKVNDRFKRAAIALVLNDFEKEMKLSDLLDNTDWCKDDSKIKDILLKKLKGDYLKDKKLILDTLNISKDEDIDIDAELYLIYQIKNWEYIRAYFDTEKLEEVKEVLNRYTLATEVSKITIKDIA